MIKYQMNMISVYIDIRTYIYISMYKWQTFNFHLLTCNSRCSCCFNGQILDDLEDPWGDPSHPIGSSMEILYLLEPRSKNPAGCLIGIFISWFIVIPTSLGKCLSRIYPRQPRFLCIAHVKDPWKSCKNCQLLRQKINVKDTWQILSTSCNIQKVRKSTKT